MTAIHLQTFAELVQHKPVLNNDLLKIKLTIMWEEWLVKHLK